MQIDCRWILRGHLDLHCRKTVSALRQYNAPASLESSERKIKISKGFWNVEVAENGLLVGSEILFPPCVELSLTLMGGQDGLLLKLQNARPRQQPCNRAEFPQQTK
jgi:hypothetical protein